ncbi:alpha/beta hydrolase family protein [Schlesneria paludicola]|uniref:alpha/beta hydrolase family protein n=1 Tax=Schlesneria paludicola TaxID=360056 RepID=UPI00029B1F13|nr:dienelactone hydrolase family protein [Schlesneria paludicola]
MRVCLLAVLVCLSPVLVSAQDTSLPLPGTQLLKAEKPLDVLMIEGIDRFCLKEIVAARLKRESLWQRDFSNAAAYEKSLAPYREKFRTILGAVDPRVETAKFELAKQFPSLAPSQTGHSTGPSKYSVEATRWQTLAGIAAEGLLLIPEHNNWNAMVIVIPDARWSPDLFSGAAPGTETAISTLPQRLAENGCLVVIPTLINRNDDFAGNPEIAMTNQSNREWVYRSAFEMGRHVIGYEVQKVLAAVDLLTRMNAESSQTRPIGVAGIGDGGQLALYSAALDNRINSVLVSGYFQQREAVWQEPIDRNVWRLLTEFGDAQLASMIAPRTLVIEACQVPETDGPLPVKPGRRGGAAPGQIKTADIELVQAEFKLAQHLFEQLKVGNQLRLVSSGADGRGPGFSDAAVVAFMNGLGWKNVPAASSGPTPRLRVSLDRAAIQQRQVTEAVQFTQNLLRDSYKTRDKRVSKIDRSSVESWVASADRYRDEVYEELIGKLPEPVAPLNPRTRQVLDEKDFRGYEVVLDTYPDVIAAGILLLPKDMKPDERRPVVVCQHGLEGVPMDTISGPDSDGYKYYKSFAVELVKRGFITYSPQNPYRGKDLFRTLQRKSNPLGRSLFSYIIPQHQVTLKWLASLPNVDANRLAFYGLSYGGKTAVRVPPLLPPREGRPGYCLSICSADFNEWVNKNASVELPFTYVFTPEYEIFEWNMGHVANYAELSMLMTPRPFMVERGHDDGVGLDEWVAFEYAKVRRHYSKLNLADKTEIEFFNGPHTINGKATFAFLHRHLNWPQPQN